MDKSIKLQRMQTLFDQAPTIESNVESSAPNSYALIASVATTAARLLRTDSSISNVLACNKALREALRELRNDMRDYSKLAKARKVLQSLGDKRVSQHNSIELLERECARKIAIAKAQNEGEAIADVTEDDDDDIDSI